MNNSVPAYTIQRRYPGRPLTNLDRMFGNKGWSNINDPVFFATEAAAIALRDSLAAKAPKAWANHPHGIPEYRVIQVHTSPYCLSY